MILCGLCLLTFQNLWIIMEITSWFLGQSRGVYLGFISVKIGVYSENLGKHRNPEIVVL